MDTSLKLRLTIRLLFRVQQLLNDSQSADAKLRLWASGQILVEIDKRLSAYSNNRVHDDLETEED